MARFGAAADQRALVLVLGPRPLVFVFIDRGQVPDVSVHLLLQLVLLKTHWDWASGCGPIIITAATKMMMFGFGFGRLRLRC